MSVLEKSDQTDKQVMSLRIVTGYELNPTFCPPLSREVTGCNNLPRY
jgi:hypothetical protein